MYEINLYIELYIVITSSDTDTPIHGEDRFGNKRESMTSQQLWAVKTGN